MTGRSEIVQGPGPCFHQPVSAAAGAPRLASPARHRTLEGLTRVGARLRVAVIAPATYPVVEPYAGGLESFVGRLVAGLRDRGHEVLLFAAEGSPGAVPGYEFPSGGWQAGDLARQDVSMPAQRFMAEHHAYLRLMTALRTEFADLVDVVHNNSLHQLPIAFASTVPAPVLTTLHTPPTPWLESAVDAVGTDAGAFTCVSRSTARQWSHLLPECTVVPNGVEQDRWPLGPGGPDLLWFGRIVAEKAPHLAVAAAARAGRTIELAGPVSDPAYFAEFVEPLLGERVRYLGHLAGADLAAAVGRAGAVLVTPVWDEPFGLVIAESAMCGTPVVAFDRGAVTETLSPRGSSAMGRVVPAGDVAAMAAAVDDVLLLDRRRVRREATRRFAFDRVVDSYEGVYRELVATAAQVDEAAS